jgi:hypothetical protein
MLSPIRMFGRFSPEASEYIVNMPVMSWRLSVGDSRFEGDY